MTANRDSKGKFTKAAEPMAFKIGDHVQKINSTHRSMTPNGTHGVIDAVDPIGVSWDGHHRQIYGHPHESIKLAPAPCPFKVGDRVVGTTARSDRWPAEKIPGRVGVIISSRDVYPARGDSDQPHGINWPDGSHSLFGDIDIDHAPEEDAPAKPEVVAQRYRDELHRTEAELRDALAEVTLLKEQAKERANAYSQNTQYLQAELTKAKRDAAATQSDWEGAHELLDKAGIAMGSPALGVHLLKRICVLISHHDHERKGREAAEAKLADIAAINRVAEIVNALPEGSEDWHFQGLVAGVVKGGVAA